VSLPRFVFIKRKVLLMHTDLFMIRMMKMLWLLEYVQIGLNDLKIRDFNITDKERFGRPAAMEEDKMRKDGKKSWKIFPLIYIASFFFYCNKKKLQKISKNFVST